jgi:hypothetical protein
MGEEMEEEEEEDDEAGRGKRRGPLWLLKEEVSAWFNICNICSSEERMA